MSSQLIIFFLLFGVLQGILITLFFISRKIYRNGYLYLLIYMGILLLQLTLKVMNKAWLMENWGIFYSFAHLLPLLYGPLVYLFVRSKTENRLFHFSYLLHLLPFAGMGMLMAWPNNGNEAFLADLTAFNPHFRVAATVISLVIYHSLAWETRRKSNTISVPDSTGRDAAGWINTFIPLAACTGLVVTVSMYFMYLRYPNGHEYRYGFGALTVFIYWITYMALNKPEVFRVIKGQTGEIKAFIPKLTVHRPAKKYAGSTLSEREKRRITQALDMEMNTSKAWLDPELTMETLADKIGCTRHALSQVVNECKQQTFIEYVNRLRIDESCRLLADPDNNHFTVASLAYDSGFNSISSFNEVFKKYTGLTPSQFRRKFQAASVKGQWAMGNRQ